MGKDDSASRAADQATLAQTRMAHKLFTETDPIRNLAIEDAVQFLAGNRSVTELPEFQAAKGASEAQFSRARDNIISSTPAGGGLTAALAGLEGTRASNQVAFTGDIAGNEIDRALQLGTFGAAQGLGGQGNAGFLQGQLAQTEAMQNSGKSSGAGSAAAAVAATMIMKNPGAGDTASKLAMTGGPSDRRLKKNIRHIGLYGPHNLYAFDYLDGTHSVGVMAQEMPDKYVSKVNGYLMVDYGMLSHG